MVDALLKGLALGLMLALSVGPVIFTIIKQSISNGREGGLSFVTGVWLSDIFLIAISIVFSEWVKSNLEHFEKIIGFTGSIFLVGLGLFYIFFKKVTIKQNADGNATRLLLHDYIKIGVSGFLINTLNPTVILFWNATALSLMSNTLQQRIIIFSTCILFNILADTGKVLMAGMLRKRLTLHTISIINKISGLILIGFGIALLYGVMFMANKL